MNVSVILPAAGLGTRMGREKSGTSRKQFMLLEGAPILIHTIRKFLRCPSVTEGQSRNLRMVWIRIGAPSSSMNCLRLVPAFSRPMRVPSPAAGRMTETFMVEL